MFLVFLLDVKRCSTHILVEIEVNEVRVSVRFGEVIYTLVADDELREELLFFHYRLE